VKDGVLLDKEDIVAEEEAGKEQDADDVNVYTAFHLFSSFLHCWIGHIGIVIMTINFFSSMHIIFLC